MVFRETVPLHAYGLALKSPVLSSVDPFAALLSVAAALALFRFKVGMIPTLLGCSAAGVALQIRSSHRRSR